MPSNMSSSSKKNKQNIQTTEASVEYDSSLETKCAGCGDIHPEYMLDDRYLCYDCYKAERYYWAKVSPST